MISKDYTIKTKEEIDNDITSSYIKLIKSQKNSSIIKIDLTKTNDRSFKEYNFHLRKLFNSIRKKFKNYILDYIFVIEIPKSISQSNYLITQSKINYHSHIVINTNIAIIDLLKEFKENFKELKTYYIYEPYKKKYNPDLYLEDISNRFDKNNYYNYLIKQHTTNNYSYNYKIK